MPLDVGKVPKEKADISLHDFNQRYLTAQRPVLIKNYASDWPACEKWPGKDYLVKTAGPTKSSVMVINLTDEGEADMY